MILIPAVHMTTYYSLLNNYSLLKMAFVTNYLALMKVL